MTLAIGLSLSPTWLREDAWRRPDSGVEELFQVEYFAPIAQVAEQAGIDFLFTPDALVLDPAALAHGPGFASLDPMVLLSALARETNRIGLIPTLSASVVPPLIAARQVQSLDAISRGRAGWNVVTSLGDAPRAAGLPAGDPDPYDRADSFLADVERLRRSFPQEALILDRERGVFADPALIRTHPARPTGPTTLPAGPAPWPLLHAGGSARSRDLAARTADAVFTMAADLDEAIAARAALRDRVAEAGRPSDAVRVLPGLAAFVAKTRAEAEALRAAAGPRRGPAHVRHWEEVGTPREVADAVIRRADAGALDGVILLPMGSLESLRLLVEEVVPLLVDAGVARGAYRGTTLREHLGMAS